MVPKVKDIIQGWIWRISAYDPCVFIDDRARLILQLHVDDMTVFGSKKIEIIIFSKPAQ